MTTIVASNRYDMPYADPELLSQAITAGSTTIEYPVLKTSTKDDTRVQTKTETIQITPDTVDRIVFMSKDYGKFLKIIPISSIPYYFYFTINGKTPLELASIKIKDVIEQYKILMDIYGMDAVGFRFDPIIIYNPTLNNLEQSLPVLEKLHKLGVRTVYTSFLELTLKTRTEFIKNSIPIFRPNVECMAYTLDQFLDILPMDWNIVVNCYSDELYNYYQSTPVQRIQLQPCIMNKASKNTRVTHKHCHCSGFIDIGRFVSCPLNCLYCRNRVDF